MRTSPSRAAPTTLSICNASPTGHRVRTGVIGAVATVHETECRLRGRIEPRAFVLKTRGFTLCEGGTNSYRQLFQADSRATPCLGISERFQLQIVKGGRGPDDFAFPIRSTPGGPDPLVTKPLLAHVAGRSTHRAGSESGMRPPATCSPQSIAFPPPPPPTGHPRRCSAASGVLRDRPTSHGRACRNFGLRPSPADPAYHRQWVPVGSPVSRAKSFHACSGSPTARGRRAACR
jgi:hypothetical protein